VDLWAVIAGGPYCSKRHLLGPWHTGNKRASTREVRVGSKTVLTALKRHFRSSPRNGHYQTGTVGLFGATSGLMHRSKRRLNSITSSARASIVGGTVEPNALAVFRLMASSNPVGCTGCGKALRTRRSLPQFSGPPGSARAREPLYLRPQVSGVNAPVESTTPRVPFTLQSFSPASVPAGGAASGRSSSDPSGSKAKIVTPVEST
jgi:hypothetical protein